VKVFLISGTKLCACEVVVFLSVSVAEIVWHQWWMN